MRIRDDDDWKTFGLGRGGPFFEWHAAIKSTASTSPAMELKRSELSALVGYAVFAWGDSEKQMYSDLREAAK
jgi:hypothetical protein